MSDKVDWWDELVLEYEKINPGEKVQELLGQGNSAVVFKLIKSGRAVALKIYKPHLLQGQNEVAERYRLSLHERMKDHDCRPLVQIYDIGELLSSAFIIMELVPWPSLDSVLGAIPVEAMPKLIGDVALAVQWMETNSLVHRDIKPANILISPDYSAAKLVDFGVVRSIDGTSPDLTDHGSRRPFLATAQYSSPEYLFRLVEPSEALWKGLSIYQVGAVLHDMLERRPLFNEEVLAENRYVLAMSVLKKTPPFYGRDYPVAWGALARRALTKELDVRLRSVSLNDFTKLDVFDADSARERLGLGKPAPLGIVESASRETERKRLRLRKVLEEFQEGLAHQLRAEGYSRIRWLQHEEDSVWLVVQVPALERLFVSFRLQASLQDVNLQLMSGANLDVESPSDVTCERLLWEGALDSASSGLMEEAVPLASELLLRSLVKASDAAMLNDRCEVPMPLLEEL